MPKYMPNQSMPGTAPADQAPVTLPAGPEILATLKAGTMVEVTMMAEVVGMTDSTVDVRISSIEIYPEAESEEEAGMRAGYEEA